MMISNAKDHNHLINLALAAGDGGIEAQEAAGQRELTASEMLPTEGDWAAIEAMGIIPGDVTIGDPLFRSATLPMGWKKRPTEHSMWSEIVDDKGIVKAEIFYKAAFYDRRAFVRVAYRRT